MLTEVQTRRQFDELLRNCTNYETLPAFHAGRVRTDLTRMRIYAERLGHPERHAPVLHVTGTKGKGSTATLAARVLHGCGAKVGLHTSPHLIRMEERVAVDGEPIGEEDLLAATNEILTAQYSGPDPGFPTFFEFMTLVACLHFRRAGVTHAVHEVGMGGALDATNIVHPAATIITNIALEHTAVLGNTPDEIAREKSGIVKSLAPVITGLGPSDAGFEVIAEAARERDVPLLVLGRDLFVDRVERLRDGGMVVDLRTPRRRFRGIKLRLTGHHQAQNLVLALAAVESLMPAMNPEKVADCLACFSLPGRLELFAKKPITILDGAHTPASLELALAEAEAYQTGRVVVLLAMAEDKDLPGSAQVVARADHVVTTRYSSPRAADPTELAEQVRIFGGRAETEADPDSAYRRACELADIDGLVLVTGSLYLVGLLRSKLVATREAEGSSSWNM